MYSSGLTLAAALILNQNPFFEMAYSILSQKNLSKESGNSAANHNANINPLFGVGAGFIPARKPAEQLLRAGINPAPTNIRCRSNLKSAGSVLAISFGTRFYKRLPAVRHKISAEFIETLNERLPRLIFGYQKDIATDPFDVNFCSLKFKLLRKPYRLASAIFK